MLVLSKKANYQDKQTIEILKKELLNIKSKRILLYCPIGLEVNIYPLIYQLRKQKGIKIFIPYVDRVSFKVVPFRLPLIKNQFNIFEPKQSLFYLTKIDTAIIPVLGIDKNFKRIGFGKGMYDRFFEMLKYRPNIIFVARKMMVSKDIITDSYDILGDKFISNFCATKRGIDDRILSDRFYNIQYYNRK
ncbi:5-formyltetrahydrofolate cyclo-ligase [Helicobacter sp. 13S00477-4]|nr:5-formyltetrahydrofolate cyclo-ligase [Helicobacter sp. 13S00477-4]